MKLYQNISEIDSSPEKKKLQRRDLKRKCFSDTDSEDDEQSESVIKGSEVIKNYPSVPKKLKRISNEIESCSFTLSTLSVFPFLLSWLNL